MKTSTLWKIRGKDQWAFISKGKTFSESPIWIRWCSPKDFENDPVRLAFAISKKYGNAVARNKFKRRTREIVRKKSIEKMIPMGTFILVGVSSSNKKIVTNEQIENAILAFISSLK